MMHKSLKSCKKVSIVIPVYNAVEHLEKCIESAIAQTYSNIEIVIVDDGSTDGSTKICERYSTLDSRVVFVFQRNSGVSEARNTGLRISSGYYTMFLDSDDWFKPTAVERAVNLIENHDVDCVRFDYTIITDQAASPSILAKEPRLYLFDNEESRFSFLIRDLLEIRIGWTPWGAIYKSEIIRANNVFFVDYGRVIAEDLLFNLWFFAAAKSCFYSSERLYFYRVRSTSLTRLNQPNYNLNALNELSKLAKSRFVDGWVEKKYCQIHKSIIFCRLRGVSRLSVRFGMKMHRETQSIEDPAFFRQMFRDFQRIGSACRNARIRAESRPVRTLINYFASFHFLPLYFRCCFDSFVHAIHRRSH